MTHSHPYDRYEPYLVPGGYFYCHLSDPRLDQEVREVQRQLLVVAQTADQLLLGDVDKLQNAITEPQLRLLWRQPQWSFPIYGTAWEKQVRTLVERDPFLEPRLVPQPQLSYSAGRPDYMFRDPQTGMVYENVLFELTTTGSVKLHQARDYGLYATIIANPAKQSMFNAMVNMMESAGRPLNETKAAQLRWETIKRTQRESPLVAQHRRDAAYLYSQRDTPDGGFEGVTYYVNGPSQADRIREESLGLPMPSKTPGARRREDSYPTLLY